MAAILRNKKAASLNVQLAIYVDIKNILVIKKNVGIKNINIVIKTSFLEHFKFKILK